MRRVCLLTFVLCSALAVAAPAFALPHLSKSRTREIGILVNRWVDDMVRRQNLADGWSIAGPDMRGALTRRSWVSGREVPVQQLEVLNDPRTAWYAKWKTRTEIGLVVSLRTGHGKKAEMYQDETMLAKRHGRWVVDSFYTDGIFRLGAGHSGSCATAKCKVTGPADYAPGGGGGVAAATPRIGGKWAVAALFTIAGLPVLGLVGMGLVAHTRNRRARARYEASRSA